MWQFFELPWTDENGVAFTTVTDYPANVVGFRVCYFDQKPTLTKPLLRRIFASIRAHIERLEAH